MSRIEEDVMEQGTGAVAIVEHLAEPLDELANA